MGDAGKEITTPLSIWDQSTSRFHVRIVVCFPLANSRRDEASLHLAAVLKRLSEQRPDLAGKLHLGPRRGWVYHTQSPEFEIPFEAINIADDFEYAYSELRALSFPASAFVHKRFDYPGNIRRHDDVVPVAGIRAFFIEGGLILSINFHHAFGDGELLQVFLDIFAAATRGEIMEPYGNRDLDFARKCNGHGHGHSLGLGNGHDHGHALNEKTPSFEYLLQRCTEFTELRDLSGPNQPTPRPGGRPESEYEKDGKIFVFDDDKIQAMKEVVEKNAPSPHHPSAYTCLATLLWVHSAKARCHLEKNEPSWATDEAATMSNPVNWRYRAFRRENKRYFGNAVALAQTHVSKSEVLAACDDEATWAKLVRKVEAGIRAVDEEYVRNRVEMFEAAPDPRNLGLCMDGRIPQDLAFNTWRDYGADTEWDICGDGNVTKPEVLRRAQVVWNMGGTLILPARKESKAYEVLLTIPLASMELLCRDEAFLKRVTRVV